MIEERAVVMESGPGYAWLEIQRQSACGSCHASIGCGTAALASIWSGKKLRVRALADFALQSGDEVIVGMADGVVLRGALLVYLLPLALLFAGAMLGQVVFATTGEELVVVCGALGLGLGFVVTRVLSKRFRSDARYQPVVLRRATTAAAIGQVLSSP